MFVGYGWFREVGFLSMRWGNITRLRSWAPFANSAALVRGDVCEVKVLLLFIGRQ
jgi:hypothetical protein